jgi:hypothetical protein
MEGEQSPTDRPALLVSARTQPGLACSGWQDFSNRVRHQKSGSRRRAANYSERTDELEALCESWERIGNRHLERHGF